MQKIIGVKRFNDNNLYYFSHENDLKVGDFVVVNFEEFQTVVSVKLLDPISNQSVASDIIKIVRVATEADLKKYNELQQKAKTSLKNIKAKSLELGLMMKFVSAEYSLDNSKMIIVFSSEERVDFRQFLKELASMFKTRIELKQIGQRDEVRICGGVGPCGEPCCCARFLKDFEHVTVKMAKIQGLSLAPTKINGICGRLMCCLGYEAGTYEEILSKMPKMNTEVKSPNGKGVVVYNDILRERVSVKRQAEGDTFVVEDFALEEIEFAGHPAKKVEPKKEEKTSSELDAKLAELNISKENKSKEVVSKENNQNKSAEKPANKENKLNKPAENSDANDANGVQNKPHKKHHFGYKNKNKQKSYNNKNNS